MSRPTVHDLAKAAGVSLATVDRVLNERPGVRPGTITRVRQAVAEIGYVRDHAAATLARQRAYNLAFILPDTDNGFVRALRDAITEAMARVAADRITLTIVPAPAHDPHALVKALTAAEVASADGVAIMAPETPHLRDAVRRLRQEGKPVVALVSNLPNTDCDHFVGIDNIAAGRTAAVLMGRFMGAEPSTVLVLAGSMQTRDHVERRLGFDEVMRARFPHLHVMPTIEGWEDGALVERLVGQALDRTPMVRGVYSAAAGNRGLLRAVRARDLSRRLTIIAHEATPAVRDALGDGTIDAAIAQDVGHLVRSAVRVLRARLVGHSIIPSQERIRIDIFLKENLLE